MKVAIGLGNDFAFDVVGTEDGLLKLHISERHKWEAEALKRFPTALVVEDFTVRREIQAANLRQISGVSTTCKKLERFGKTNVGNANGTGHVLCTKTMYKIFWSLNGTT